MQLSYFTGDEMKKAGSKKGWFLVRQMYLAGREFQKCRRSDKVREKRRLRG
jgi:hypothetical protein